MTIMRLVVATWLLLSTVFLSACANNQPASAVSLAEPHCGNSGYGTTKVGAREVASPASISVVPVGDFGSDGILIMDHPLGVPPEIARVRRGITSQFVGAFINDGLENWDAVDLDRKVTISVQRRIFDKRAEFTKQFGDPVFPDFALKSMPRFIFGRKWASDQRTEEEVVVIEPLTSAAAEAVVCTANAVWTKSISTIIPMPTDALSFNDSLLDFDPSSKKEYEKDAPAEGALAWVIGQLSKDQLKYKW